MDRAARRDEIDSAFIIALFELMFFPYVLRNVAAFRDQGVMGLSGIYSDGFASKSYLDVILNDVDDRSAYQKSLQSN